MIIANTFGILFFLFLIWRALKEDYHYEKIFNLGFSGLIAVLVAFIISSFIDGVIEFWIYVIFAVLIFLFSVRKQKMKFFECFEAYFIGFLPWITFLFLSDSVKYSSLSSFLSFWLALFSLFIYFFCKANYRSFTWYKSGRVGFAGVTSLIVFFVLRSVLNIVFFGVALDIFLSISASLLLFILMYNLFSKNGK